MECLEKETEKTVGASFFFQRNEKKFRLSENQSVKHDLIYK